MNNFPDFSGKKRIIFVDNVTREFAINNGKLYDNAIFFTTNNEIFKGGEGIANYVTVNPNFNTFNGPNSLKYTLSIDNNGVLSIHSGNVWLWYIGMQKWNESQPLMNSNWSNYPNDDNGWFLITTDSNITEKVNGEVDKGIWWAGREYEINKENGVENIIIPSNKRQAWKPFSNPLYSYDFDYKNSQGDQITETCKINLGNIDGYSTVLDNGNSIFRIDLLLPTIMVDSYKIGLYDDLENINYLEEAKKYDSEAFRNNIESLNPGIYYTQHSTSVEYPGGIQYYWYKIFVITSLPKSELNKAMYFDMHLYNKE